MERLIKTLSLALVLLFIIVSCTANNENKSQQELAEQDNQFREVAYNNDQIIVIESFHPTITLTPHQKEISLDSLVKEHFKQSKINRENVGTQIALARAGKVIVPVAVPKESDLAKAFFLQEFWLFYDQNQQYIKSLLSSNNESKTREDWDKYL